jgi:hypothetical protein
VKVRAEVVTGKGADDIKDVNSHLGGKVWTERWDMRMVLVMLRFFWE